MILRYIRRILKLFRKEDSRENSSWLEKELQFYRNLSKEAKARSHYGFSHRKYIHENLISGEDYR